MNTEPKRRLPPWAGIVAIILFCLFPTMYVLVTMPTAEFIDPIARYEPIWFARTLIAVGPIFGAYALRPHGWKDSPRSFIIAEAAILFLVAPLFAPSLQRLTPNEEGYAEWWLILWGVVWAVEWLFRHGAQYDGIIGRLTPRRDGWKD